MSCHIMSYPDPLSMCFKCHVCQNMLTSNIVHFRQFPIPARREIPEFQATRRFDQKARFRLREHKLSTSRDAWNVEERQEKGGESKGKLVLTIPVCMCIYIYIYMCVQ